MKLVIGIGVPGCGKSTFLKPIADQLGVVYISSDEIREELTGNAALQTREAEVWKTVHERIAEALQKDGAVVDATFTRKQDRQRLIQAAKRTGINEIEGYWFNVPLRVCIERNRKRPRVVPENVIRKMHARLTLHPPTLDEGFTKIVEITS